MLSFIGEWAGGKLRKGKTIYRPTADTLNSEYLSSENQLLISAKLQKWLDNEINDTLYPINKKLDEDINSEIRAIVFNCFENFGNYPIEKFKDILKSISQESKHQLSKLELGLVLNIFYTKSLKKPLELCAILWKPLSKWNRSYFATPIKWQSIIYIRNQNA